MEGSTEERKSRAKLVGKVVNTGAPSVYHLSDETSINLCLSQALEAVQESLRSKPSFTPGLRANAHAQLRASGWLLDENNQPLAKDGKGCKTKQLTIGGERRRCVRIRIGSICPAKSLMDVLGD